MTIGANQRNILMFEVGMRHTVDILGLQAQVLTPVSVHPMVVAPASWQYTDASRTRPIQTLGGTTVPVAGRNLRNATFEGSFGVEERGVALYVGTGEQRFRRFYNEVVRMSDALSADDIDSAVDVLSGTPGIAGLVRPFEPGNSLLYINMYDFWNGLSFQVRINNFQWRRDSRGGASGEVHYTMQVQEAGPLIESTLASTALGALMSGLTTWDSVNDVLRAYAVPELVDSIAVATAPIVAGFEESLQGVNAQLDGVQALMGGAGGAGGTSSSTSVGSGGLTTGSGGDGVATFFQEAEALAEQADDLARRVSTSVDPRFVAERGRIHWPKQADGSEALAAIDAIADLRNVADAARAQRIMGTLFGQSRDDFFAYITSGGATTSVGPDVGGSIVHTVSDTDTADTIVTRYGVAWGRILSLNRLTPDEALRAGRSLNIPSSRVGGPLGIDGLPTFDSHVGEAAWGKDVAMGITSEPDGDFLVLEGADALDQGARFLIETFGDDILLAAQQMPETVQGDYMRQRVTGILETDQRFQGAPDVTVSVAGDGSVEISATVAAINGGTVRSSGR